MTLGSSGQPEVGQSRPPAAFHLTRGYAVGALGRVSIVAGLGVLGVVAAVTLATGTFRTMVLVVGWAVVAVGLGLTVVAAVRTLRPPVLVTLNDEGVRVRVRRGGAAGSIPWAQVHTVRRELRSTGAWVVIDCTDGRSAAIPDRLVAEGGDALVSALRSRLDQVHGQRRIGRDAQANDGGGGGI